MADQPKDNSTGKTRQEAREAKLRKKKQKMKQHGKGLGKMYEDAVRKRGKGKEVGLRNNQVKDGPI